MRKNTFSLVLLFALAALSLGGCATHSDLRRGLVDNVRRGDYPRAMGQLKELHKNAPAKDLVMDLMDRGTIEHSLGRYEESNKDLDAAKQKLDELFGVKISDELEAIAWNEASKNFKGEEFERVMIHLLSAFNYLHLGSLEDAAVEARQINQRLQVYVDKLKASKISTHYEQDPFAQFLCGMIQEAYGDDNDAYRSFEDALNGYVKMQPFLGIPAPEALKAGLYRLAAKLNFEEAKEKYAAFAALPGADPVAWAQDGHVVVLAGLGEIAHKKSEKWTVPDPQGDVVSVTYPVFRRGSFLATHVTVSTGTANGEAVMATDLSTLAIKTLDDKNAQVKGKAIAKALARYAAKKVARAVADNTKNDYVQAGALIANLALNVVDLVETADTRSWMTLPDHYRVTVQNAKPGTAEIVARFLTDVGALIDEQHLSLPIKAGQTRFVVLRAREGTGPKAAPALPKDAVAPLAPAPAPKRKRKPVS